MYDATGPPLDFTSSPRPICAAMLARALVNFYRFYHGTLHLKGAGKMLRSAARVIPGLRAFPFAVAGVGTIVLDFRDTSATGMVNMSMGELGETRFLLDVLSRLLKPGDVFWDVGANVGWIAAHLTQERFQLASIQCFEPNPAAYKPLQSLFRNHRLVRIHPFGLGDQNGSAELRLYPGETGRASLKEHVSGEVKASVVLRRGDDSQEELSLPLPNAIKIDVEGFEPQVLRGMTHTIAKSRPAIVFEYQFLSDDEIRAMIPPGYEMLLMLDDGRLTSDFSKRALGHDAVLFTKEHAARLNDVPRV